MNCRQLYAILPPVSHSPPLENLMSESKTNLYRTKLDVVPRTVAATDFADRPKLGVKAYKSNSLSQIGDCKRPV